MTNIKSLLACISLTTLVLGAPAHAGVSPLGLAIVPPVQIPTRDYGVAGIRASVLWGEHRDVYGIDLGGVGNISQNHFWGLAVAGGFNWNKGEATIAGLQAAGVFNLNVNKAKIVGLQVAPVINANLSESTHVGLAVSLLNHSPHMTLVGLQTGLYNRARNVYGIQVGLFNFTENLHGIQLGLLNFNSQGLFAVAPLLNVGF